MHQNHSLALFAVYSFPCELESFRRFEKQKSVRAKSWIYLTALEVEVGADNDDDEGVDNDDEMAMVVDDMRILFSAMGIQLSVRSSQEQQAK